MSPDTPLTPPHLSPHQMSTLVLAEVKGTTIMPSTLNTATAAQKFNKEPITVLLTGHNIPQSATQQASTIPGITSILVADHPSLDHTLAEPTSALVSAILLQGQQSSTSSGKYKRILAPASTFGKNILPRIAALLDVQAITDVIEIINDNTFVRPIYAGNALATVKSLEGESSPRCLTIRPTAFPAADGGTGDGTATTAAAVPVESVSEEALKAAVAAASTSSSSEWSGEEMNTSARPELGQAKVVISGGRALKSADNFAMLEKLADVFGGAVGASRAAVDAGYITNDLQVGQTGKVVAPELYIAVGISGAIQHVAGMKDSKVIVAINSDAEAPIFEIADYGLVGDLFKLVPELEEAVVKAKS